MLPLCQDLGLMPTKQHSEERGTTKFDKSIISLVLFIYRVHDFFTDFHLYLGAFSRETIDKFLLRRFRSLELVSSLLGH